MSGPAMATKLHWTGRVALVALLAIGSAIAANEPFILVAFASYAGIGSFLVLRRPDNLVGWLLVVQGWTFIGTTTPQVDIEALLAARGTPRDMLVTWLGGWVSTAWFVSYFALAGLFPSGHLTQGRWRRPTQLLLGIGAAFTVMSAISPTLPATLSDGLTEVQVPNPLAVLPGLPIWKIPWLPTLVVGGSLAMVAVAGGVLVIRYRAATGVLRQQLRWLVAAVAFVAVGLGTGFTVMLATGELTGWYVALLSFPTVPLAIGVAVLRYRLYDLDRIVSRSISYGVVTLALFALFAAVNLTAQAALGQLAGGNTAAVAVSTLVVAAAFSPVRIRLQRLVDRRFNRGRMDQEQALTTFATGLRREYDADRIVDHMRTTIVSALEPQAVGVWRRDGQRALTADPMDHVTDLPVPAQP